MVYSSVEIKASFAFLILYFMVFDCSSVPLYTNGTNSKRTPTNSTVSVDYNQSVSYDTNEHISTINTSQGAEAKPQSYVNKTENDATSSKDEETSLMNGVKNKLAVDNTHNSRRFSRSKRSTRLCMPETRRIISSEVFKWIIYLSNCVENNYSKSLVSCSVNDTEVC
jgi:hypothetical protein